MLYKGVYHILLILADIYGHSKNMQKSKAYLPMVPDGIGWSTLTTIDKEQHRFKRRLLSSGLGENTLQGFQSVMLQYIDDFCEKLGAESTVERDSSPRNMIQWAEFFTLDIISDFAFGQKLNMMGSATNRFIIDTLHQYSWTMGLYEQMPSLAKLKVDQIARLLFTCSASQIAWTKWSRDFGARVLKPRSAKRVGIFSNIINAKDPSGRSLPHQELWAEGSFLMLAGMQSPCHPC